MKPYDVEQAKADVAERAQRVMEEAASVIARAADDAAEKLEAQARAFEQIGKADVAGLYKVASTVVIAEIDVGWRPTTGKRAAETDFSIMLQYDGTQRHLGSNKIPARKHRVIAFVIPIEE